MSYTRSAFLGEGAHCKQNKAFYWIWWRNKKNSEYTAGNWWKLTLCIKFARFCFCSLEGLLLKHPPDPPSCSQVKMYSEKKSNHSVLARCIYLNSDRVNVVWGFSEILNGGADFSPSHQRGKSVTPSDLQFQWVLRFSSFCEPVLLEGWKSNINRFRKNRKKRKPPTQTRPRDLWRFCSIINHFMYRFYA